MPGSKASLDGTISRACYLRLLREKQAATGTSAEGHAKGNRVSAHDGCVFHGRSESSFPAFRSVLFLFK